MEVHIKAVIAMEYDQYFQQNVEKLTDDTNSTLIYKTDSYLWNYPPHLRKTMTEWKKPKMSMHQLGIMKRQEFDYIWRHAARKVVDSDSISLGDGHITDTETL